MRKTYKIRRSEVSLGMTLIELMVVTSIMLILVVMSVPVFKPMLESRKQADGAQTLSIYLNVARIRATETGRPCGVMFERYTDNNYQEDGETVFPNNDTCLVVRQVEVPPPYCGSLEDIRVAVYRNGNIAFFAWRDAEFDNNGNVLEQAHWRETSNEDAFWNAMVGVGDKIQFDNQGLYFTLNSATASSGSATLTVGAGPGILTNERRYRVNEVYIYKDRQGTEYLAAYAPVPFKVLRAPKPTLTAPIGFPTGIVVDLEYSGINNGDYIMTGNGDAAPLTRGSDFRPAGPSTQEPVYVMFSPSGGVDSYRCDGVTRLPSGPIHFLIGKWEKAGNYWDDSGERNNNPDEISDRYEVPGFEGALRNYQDMSNFWVTIHPYSGAVTTTEVAYFHTDTTASWLRNSRQYANQPK